MSRAVSRVGSSLALALAATFAIGPAWPAPPQPAGTTSGLRVELHSGAPPAGEVEVGASVSRTALWVGDRVTYTVEIACAPNVDVLTEDLAPDKLVLSGLEVVSTDREQGVSKAGGATYRVRYHLTAYEVAAPALRIGDRTVRYYVRRAGQRVEDVAPAGEARVPGAVLALRSTIPDDLPALALRDAREPAPLPPAVRLARPVGVGLILLSALPVALWAAALVARIRTTRSQRRPRQGRHVMRSALEELRAVDASKDADRRAAYGRLDAMLRQHIAEVTDIPAPALTAAEIAERLRANGSRLPAEAIGAVLEDCERARYGPAGLLPPAQRFRAGVVTVEELLAGR